MFARYMFLAPLSRQILTLFAATVVVVVVVVLCAAN